MIYVCDAIMGSGKTSAAINYINAHPEKRFLYIAPYLQETARVKAACPDAHFVEPSDKLPQYEFTKSLHTIALVERGENIATTHKAMLFYTPSTIALMKEQGYSVIIDEQVEVLEEDHSMRKMDLNIAIETGFIKQVSPGVYARTDKEYTGTKFWSLFRMMESRNLMFLSTKDGDVRNAWHWIFIPDMFRDLDEVILLTYMFAGSEMDSFFKLNGLTYEWLGVKKPSPGVYEFCPPEEKYIPQYVHNLKDTLHVYQDRKLNKIGESPYSLSMNWFEAKQDGVDVVRKNINTFFIGRMKSPSDARLCGTYKKHWPKLRQKGYWNSGISFTQRSTNEFSDKTILAYPVNIFINRDIARLYSNNEVPIDEERYALSTMIQWIWRSAIRNGKEVWLYVPSKRMRDLLLSWIEEVSTGEYM